ncbi:MAG: phage holin family protein [Fimbriimonadaceae bacterium]|nr:phage holin family protein [Fimbriimonadaceae bacterium]QYK58023.1 MAG: phage holin family protein [Fimbriimonadaceae bacterium]
MTEALVTHDVQTALLVLMACDVLMGLLIAFGRKEVSSSVSRVGMARKAAVLLVVAVAYLVETYVQTPVGLATAAFFALTEALSVVENAARLGVPIPGFLRAALAKLRSEGEARPITIAVVPGETAEPSGQAGTQAKP